MNKDFLVILMQKDIKELSLLTEGFEKMNEFPEPLLRLAIQKAENIKISLESLGNNSLSELGEIDYQSFDGKKTGQESNETHPENFLSDMNNLEAPTDSSKELIHNETAETEIQNAATVLAETNEPETEVEAKEIISEVPENTDENTILSLDEEFQEEIEVEEIGENEQVLVYDESDNPQAPGIKPSENTIAETIPQSSGKPGENQLKNEINSLGDNLANQKVDDIRQAMNIGDRFRFQRELFSGNGEVMNKTIAYLNQLAKYDEAYSFLKSKFGWSDDNPHAEEFLQLVKRRYN